MRKIVLFSILVILFSTYSISYGQELDLSGESAILIDVDTMEVLYKKTPIYSFIQLVQQKY